MVSAPTRRRWVIGTVAGLCAVYLVVRSVADLHMAFGGGTAVDYLAIASAGRLVHAGSSCVYCTVPLAAMQSQLLGYIPATSATFPIPFVNPALMAWLVQPLAMLPLQTGADIFIATNVAAMALSSVILVRRARPALGGLLATFLVITVVFSLEAGTGILLGQSDGLMLLAATLAIEALDHRRPLLAGLLLTPLLLKPQLLWLVPPALIAGRQWRMLLALTVGAVVVLLGSIAISGPQNAAGLISAPTYAHLDLQSNSIPTLLARPLGSNAAAWARSGARRCRGSGNVPESGAAAREPGGGSRSGSRAVGAAVPAPRRLQPHASCRAARGPRPARPEARPGSRRRVHARIALESPGGNSRERGCSGAPRRRRDDHVA
jgi:hypothetical protein